jgi:hypothetical protein
MPFKDTLTDPERADIESVDYGPVSADPDPIPETTATVETNEPKGEIMSNKIPCPQCGSQDTSYYDGALGYEAVRCNACNEETDLNNDHAHNPRPDRPAAAPPEGSEAYKLAYVKHGAAAKVYREACKKYRAKLIGDREFIAARTAYDAEALEFDKALEAEQNKPAPEKPAPPAVDPGPGYTRMVIGETISADQVRAVASEMQNHLLGCSAPIGARVLAEEAGNMVVMTIEFRTLADALAYTSTRWYRDFVEKINHLLVGNLVHKVFQNKGGL